jgi:hypothetical protein
MLEILYWQEYNKYYPQQYITIVRILWLAKYECKLAVSLTIAARLQTIPTASLSMTLQPFWTLAASSVSWSFTQSIVLLGRGISPAEDRYPHTEQHKHRIKAHRHPCLEGDSNPRTQCLIGRRRIMPQTARPATVIGSLGFRGFKWNIKPHAASVCHLKFHGDWKLAKYIVVWQCHSYVRWRWASLWCHRGMRNNKAVVSVLTAEGWILRRILIQSCDLGTLPNHRFNLNTGRVLTRLFWGSHSGHYEEPSLLGCDAVVVWYKFIDVSEERMPPF